MFVPLLIKYTRLVKIVDADLAGRMDDALVAHHNAHVGNAPILVAKEGEVAGLCLLQEIHQVATPHLLRGITGEKESAQAGADLHQAGAVDAESGAPAP